MSEKVVFLKENISYLRKKNNLSQTELGLKLNTSSQMISNWERGYTASIQIETIVELAELFDISIDDLIMKDLRPAGALIGRNLRYLRKKENYTQTDMAKLLGYKDKSSCSLIENGLYEPSMDGLITISEFFGVTIDDLLKKDLSKAGDEDV